MKKYLLLLMTVLFSAVSYAMTASADYTSMIAKVPTTAEVKYYNRSGYYHQSSNNYAVSEQSGVTAIAFDGTDVYIQNPIAGYENNYWVKGTIDGETITIPLGQFIMWNESQGYGFYLTMVNVNGNSYTNDTETTEITYTVNGDVITQNGTSATRTLAPSWSDDNSVYSFCSPGGEYQTVFTLNPDYVPTPTVLVELPDNAEVEQWYAKGTDNGDWAKVAFVGNDVYVSGIFSKFPDSWIKGTISGSTVTFEKLQYLGDYESYHIWASAGNLETGTLEDIVMTYDAEAGTLTLDASQVVVANASDTELYYLRIFYTLVLMKNEPAPLSVDELPYTNAFDTEDQWKEFKVIDANADGSTWTQYNKMARLRWDDSNNNDDWLVSPMLKLEAGKTYKVNLQAHCYSTSYPETFEVKAAQEQHVAALSAGLEVLAATKVTSTSFVTYGNDQFTVPEDGYYCIGIHAVTTKDKAYYFFVDDFAVEETAPVEPDGLDAYTYSFAQALNGWTTIDADNDGYTWRFLVDDKNPGHNGSLGMVTSASYEKTTVLYPDNYLVSPKMKLDGKITFYANAQDAGYPAEHFGVAVSTASATDAADFQMVSEEWVMTASRGTDMPANAPARNVRRAQGSWYLYEVDLSAFAGAEGYVAIRHFNSSDNFRLNVDDITLKTSQLIDPYDPNLEEEQEPEVIQPEVVALPEGAEVYEYNMVYLKPLTGQEGSKPINVAVVGNEVYFQGMSQYLSEAWVKGTKNGNQVTFAAKQYMGDYGGYGGSYFFYGGEAVFTYDAVADTYSATGQVYGILADEYYDGLYMNPVLSRVTEVVGVPATPSISGIEATAYGDVVDFVIPTVDIDDNGLVTSKLSYQFFVDDESTPLVFTTDYFSKLTENMTVIPYGFTDDYDFYDSYIYLNMPHDTWVRLGIQSVYTGGGEENKSEIFWYEFPVKEQPVEAPVGLVTETYIFKANAMEYSVDGGVAHPDYIIQVEVGFDGDDVYIQGLSVDAPELWVKATKNGEGQYVIPANQYMGEYTFWSYTFPYYWTALDDNNNFTDAVLNFDAESGTFTTAQTLALNGSATKLEYYLLFNDVTITKFVEVAATPATPTFEDFILDERVGYSKIYASIPTLDNEGNALNTNKLYFTVWYEKDGEQQPYTFTAALYTGDFEEDVTEVPYSYDGYDIYKGGEVIYLEETLEELQSWTKVGIQSIYYGVGERRESFVAWNDNTTTGILEVNTVADVPAAIYHLSGQKVQNAHKVPKGLYIINGRKVVVK